MLKEKFGALIDALGKPSVVVPFMMPKRVADTDPFQQISDSVGSGPFVLKRDEWKPGEKVVFVKNPHYRPRAEPSSGLAGGKVAKVDRVEWLAISDQQQAINALHGWRSPCPSTQPIRTAGIAAVSASCAYRFWARPNYNTHPSIRAAWP